jgi:hypothetical protein
MAIFGRASRRLTARAQSFTVPHMNHLSKIIVLVLLLTGCAGSVAQESPKEADAAFCLASTPEAGADLSLCPGASIVTQCDRPTQTEPAAGFAQGMYMRSENGGRTWCSYPIASSVECLIADKVTTNDSTIQSYGWASYSLPPASCLHAMGGAANQSAVASGAADSCSAPANLLGELWESAPDATSATIFCADAPCTVTLSDPSDPECAQLLAAH